MVRWSVCWSLLLLAPAWSAMRVGPLPLEPSLAVYLVADGRPAAARIVVRQTTAREPERLLVRVLDPAEQLALWRWVEWLPAADRPTGPGRDELLLRDLSSPPQPGEVIFDHTVELTGSGVYQLRLLAGARNSTAEIEVSRELPYGFSQQNGDYQPARPPGGAWHVFVPPHADELTLQGAPLEVRDATDRPRARTDSPRRHTVALTAADAGTVFTVRPPASGDVRFRAAGFPLILCSSAAAARAIHASVEQLPDGTVVCWQFQRRLAELLPRLLAPAQVGDARALTERLATRRAAWLADPLRNAVLRESYLATVEHWLSRQNVDPASPWGGAMDGWQPYAGQAGPGRRWDRFRPLDGLYAGASSHCGNAAEHLARAALLKDPTNPYQGRRELLVRAAAAGLRDLMVVQEAEVFPGLNDLDPYPGMHAFAFGQKTFTGFGLAAPHLPDDVRRLWSEGLRHLVDRAYGDYLVSARNQSSHYLVAFQAYADGAGDPLYRDLAHLWARRWVRGQHPAGFHQEATGPCASYIGMTHWHEAVYYRMSGDAAVLDGLRRGYRFFNHTVAPEPDGRPLGGFNFNHRVGDSFAQEQWSGAKGILDEVLPEVGVWAEPPRTKAEATAQIERFLAKPELPLYADITTPRYLHFAAPQRGTWPAAEPEPFLRNFADEMIAVKRAGYYTVVYVGKPAAGDHYIRGREDLRQPVAGDRETDGGDLPNARKITPFLGGGLTGFWTPDYGHSLMATAWSPTCHHGLVATATDGRRYWEDYFRHRFRLDAAGSRLVIEGHLEQVPVDYRRQYHFGDQTLEVDLELTATADVALTSLVENLPYVRGPWKARGADARVGATSSGPARADRFTITDQQGRGIEVMFDEPAQLNLVPNGLKAGNWRAYQIGRVEVVLPPRLQRGQQVAVRYLVRALR